MAGHYIRQFWHQWTPGTIFVITFFIIAPWILGLYAYLTNTMHVTLRRIQDVGLENFFNILAKQQKKDWICEEVLCRERLDIQKMNDESLGELANL